LTGHGHPFARIGRLALVATVAAISLTLAATALAAGGHVKIHAHKKPHVGKTFPYSVTGRSPGRGNSVATFTDSRRCAKTRAKERHRRSRGRELDNRVKQGHFRVAKDAVTVYYAGPNYICAYLYNRKSKRTVAHAKFRFVGR
jgi:hypothetical protein